MNKALFSSNSMEWETPIDLFNTLDREFHFTLDAASTHENAKCKKHYTIAENGLAQSWAGETVWLNPPYGREIGYWMKKAYDEGRRGTTVVCLIPARTDTTWFHAYCYNKPDVEIRFIKGRLKFGNSKNSAPFPSAIVIYKWGIDYE